MITVIVGFVMFCLGFVVAVLLGAALDYERRYKELVKTVAKRTDQDRKEGR